MNHSARLILLTLLTASFAVCQWDEVEKNPLPRNLTPEERLLQSTYVPPFSPATFPPSRPVRAMAEFEEVEGIVVRWAYGTQDLLLSQIVDAAQEVGKVWVLVRPSTSDSINIRNYLTGRGIPFINIEFLSINTNSIWCRDYGPWTVYDTQTDSMAIVDFRYNRPRPQDDLVPSLLASRWNLPLYQTTQMPDSLVHTGGNFMVDGFGTAFASRLIVNENTHLAELRIDTILSQYCGVNKLVKMNTLLYDDIHHIDMHMKLLDEETLLIGQYPANVSDYAAIENTVNSLRTIPNCYGRPYRIIRIPMPPSASGFYPPNSNYYTYTNSLIINTTVLVPLYGFSMDQQALQIYRDAMPGYTIIGYDCNAIIPQLGAIHCITKEVGIREPVVISHARLGNTSDTLHDYRLEVFARVQGGVDSVLMFWRVDTTVGFSRVGLADSNGTYVGWIPHQPVGTTIWYYVETKTVSGRTVAKPLAGSGGPYRFSVENITSVPGNMSDVPYHWQLLQNYPNPFNPATIIPFKLSSSAFVEVKVFNTIGQELETLLTGFQVAGGHSVLWNAATYPSGMYFYRLRVTTDGNVSTKIGKALLMK